MHECAVNVNRLVLYSACSVVLMSSGNIPKWLYFLLFSCIVHKVHIHPYDSLSSLNQNIYTDFFILQVGEVLY